MRSVFFQTSHLFFQLSHRFINCINIGHRNFVENVPENCKNNIDCEENQRKNEKISLPSLFLEILQNTGAEGKSEKEVKTLYNQINQSGHGVDKRAPRFSK